MKGRSVARVADASALTEVARLLARAYLRGLTAPARSPAISPAVEIESSLDVPPRESPHQRDQEVA
jgi:hypothetical protein